MKNKTKIFIIAITSLILVSLPIAGISFSIIKNEAAQKKWEQEKEYRKKFILKIKNELNNINDQKFNKEWVNLIINEYEKKIDIKSSWMDFIICSSEPDYNAKIGDIYYTNNLSSQINKVVDDGDTIKITIAIMISKLIKSEPLTPDGKVYYLENLYDNSSNPFNIEIKKHKN